MITHAVLCSTLVPYAPGRGTRPSIDEAVSDRSDRVSQNTSYSSTGSDKCHNILKTNMLSTPSVSWPLHRHNCRPAKGARSRRERERRRGTVRRRWRQLRGPTERRCRHEAAVGPRDAESLLFRPVRERQRLWAQANQLVHGARPGAGPQWLAAGLHLSTARRDELHCVLPSESFIIHYLRHPRSSNVDNKLFVIDSWRSGMSQGRSVIDN